MTRRDLRLPFEQANEPSPDRDARDAAARQRAVDPRHNVALEASAGTGKTRVLVDRYVNLLRAGVDPANILAMTFTRKAAAEMRERILATLRTAAERGELAPGRWRELRDRTGDIEISTIDAFCLSLLREFPLEAGLDPGFSMAGDTEVPRLVDDALDRAMRVCRSLAGEDEHVALVFAQLGDRRVRSGLAALLARRIVAPQLLSKYLSRRRADLTVETVVARGAGHLLDAFASATDGFMRFVTSGPAHPSFMLLVRQLETIDAALRSERSPDPAAVQVAFARAREYFLTQQGTPRTRLLHAKDLFPSAGHWQRHRELVADVAPRIAESLASYRADLNVLVSRGVWRMFRLADAEYRRTLDAHAVLDFSDLLLRTLDLLRQMEEFSRSRYRLESRYHHVLVDEFQDTSRAQWELVALLVQAWGEGAGLAHTGPLPPSIFIVGDGKQSIYRFRDADVAVLPEAIRYLEGLRPDRDVRRSISRSFRSVPAILAFVNDVCRDVEKAAGRQDAFRYVEDDEFPVDPAAAGDRHALGAIVGGTPAECAEAAAAEIARLLSEGAAVRDVTTGIARDVRPGDIAVLFRTRDSHREFEDALERRGIPSYVYKGLGFFESAEVRDVLALLWHLADPHSDLRAAAWLRSGFVRLSDEALRRLSPRLAAALEGGTPGTSLEDPDARSLAMACRASERWRALVDRIPPAELLDRALAESAYAFELRGPRLRQARENLKKVRGLIRRAQNTGYATLSRVVSHLDRLAVGDESNAAVDALDAVSLMTVHASKGLEFPVAFVVNIARGTGSRRPAMRVAAGATDDEVSVSVGDFQSQSDEDEAAIEREETKRLLYVALTRARDRLYLGAVARDGVVQPARGSLAEVLPASLVAVLTSTAASAPHDDPAWDVPRHAEWRASSGGVHQLALCPVTRAVTDEARLPASRVGVEESPRDFSSLDVTPARRHPEGVQGATGLRSTPGRRGAASSRLRGVLVHRLMHRSGLAVGPAPGNEQDLAMQIEHLLTADERDEVADVESLVQAVSSAYRALASQPDVLELYRARRAWHEVPFSARLNGADVHGTIDCLLHTADEGPERVTVLEFKTGRSRSEHDDQAAMYLEAARRIFPGADVDAQVVYVDGPAAV